MSNVTDPTPQMINDTMLRYLDSGDNGLVKKAASAVDDFVRLKMREEGFFRKILPPIQVTNSDLDRQVDTDKPAIIIDMEPDSPAAASIPFATLPFNRYIRAPRCRVMFDRIATPRFTKDVEELRTYDMDIRQILSDNALKDLLAEEDGKMIATLNSLMGAENSLVPELGNLPQNVVINGGITRDTAVEAKKIIPRLPGRLEPATVLCNNVTIKEFEKWGRDEMGGDLSESMARKGYAETHFLGMDWIITIKQDLVPDNVIYMFAGPKWLGKFFVLQDTTMYIERKAYFLELFAYETIGAIFANQAAFCRVRFN